MHHEVFLTRLGTLKPPEITQETKETACSIYGCVVSTGLTSGRKNCLYKPYYIWRIFHNLGVSFDGWFKMPSARSMKTYSAEYI